MIIKGTDYEIPDSLIVNGDLDLHGSGVIELPAGISVGGYFNLRGSKVTELPNDIQVGCLYVDDWQLIASEKTQLEFIEKGKDMLQVFKNPTDTSSRLHEMLWEL